VQRTTLSRLIPHPHMKVRALTFVTCSFRDPFCAPLPFCPTTNPLCGHLRVHPSTEVMAGSLFTQLLSVFTIVWLSNLVLVATSPLYVLLTVHARSRNFFQEAKPSIFMHPLTARYIVIPSSSTTPSYLATWQSVRMAAAAL